jgi:uncharacterized OB-fold protein
VEEIMTEAPPAADAAPPTRVVAIEDRPFWDAIDRGEFVLARCTCGTYYARQQACIHCANDTQSLRWEPVSGHGVVRTFVVFDKPYHAYFKDKLPYIVAVVSLQEGPEIITNVIDADISVVAIGMPVQIVIRDRGGQKIHQASARLTI